MLSAQHRVPDRPAHQGQLVTRLAEPPAELVDHRRDPVQLRAHRPLDLRDLEGRKGGVGHDRKLYRPRLGRPPLRRVWKTMRPGYSRAMLRPLSLLPALVAVISAAAVMAAPSAMADDGSEHVSGPERVEATSRSTARTAVPARALSRDPLAVTIDTLTPSYIPRKGPILISGSVTNRTEDAFTAINLHAFVSAAPITTSAELAESAELDPDQYVGDRITTPGTFDHVDELAPGESLRYSMQVPRSEVAATSPGVAANTPGVYWFGVHALGDSALPRDETADGRARTFIPLVTQTQESVDTALVIPLRHQIRHAGDGSIADTDDWAESLGPGGALRSLVDFGASAGTRPVSWLVDPAVPDAVRALVAGNPPRSLGDTVGRDSPGGGESPSGGPSGEPEPNESASGDPDEEQPTPNPATEPGSIWLSKVQGAMAGDDVLALPYGDVDVSAAAERDPQAYQLARQRSGSTLEPWGFPTTPSVASPSGYLDPAAIGTIDRNSTILVSDRMFTEEAPPVARIGGRRLTVTSWSTEQGGPSPGDPLSAVALRQRILSEAAVRVLDPDRPPLVVVLPRNWRPDTTLGFFSGLDVDWLRLAGIDEISSRRGIGVEADSLDYPATQVRRELDAANFNSASALAAIGETLQNVLTRNQTVAGTVADESLTTLSYASRANPNAARADADASHAWIADQLGSIEVDAPRAVTLASSSGRFATTITNDLDHPVTVQLTAVTDEPLSIDAPETIDLAADSSTSVLLEAATDRLGVHNVELLVTDETGTPLGSSDQLPIRSVQVSQVIWLILGTGVALLFGTIAVRLFRRVRRATSSSSGDAA